MVDVSQPGRWIRQSAVSVAWRAQHELVEATNLRDEIIKTCATIRSCAVKKEGKDQRSSSQLLKEGRSFNLYTSSALVSQRTEPKILQHHGEHHEVLLGTLWLLSILFMV